MNDDVITKTLKQVLDILFLNNPIRSSWGFLFGVVLACFEPAFAPVIVDLLKVDFSEVPMIGWLALGLLVFNIPFSAKKEKVSLRKEEALELIAQGEKAGMSKLEVKQRFRNLVQACTDEIANNEELQNEVDRLRQQLKSD